MKVAAACAAAVAAAAVAVLVPTLAGRGGPTAPRHARPLSATATLSPREHLFGDHVRARVEVAVDPRRVDPQSVAIDARFAPYRPVAAPRLVRTSRSVRLDAELACLARACLPRGPQRQLALAPATVRYRQGAEERTAAVEWPPLLVASRLGPGDAARPVLRERTDLPHVSFAVAPPLLGWGLAAASGLLLLVAGGAVARRLARKQPLEGLRVEQVPELRRALANVERLAGDDIDARRAALDSLARTLAAAGLERLAPEARVLAWSEVVPTGDPMRRLAERIERALDGVAA